MATITKYGERGDKWLIRYNDLRGIRKSKVVLCTEEEAKFIASEIEKKKSRIRLGLEPHLRENLMLSEAMRYYYRHKQITNNTMTRIHQILKNLLNYIGNMRIRQISSIAIEEYLRKRKEEDGIKDSTVGLEFRTLRAFFNYYTDHNFLVQSPMKRMKTPRVPEKKIRFLTEEEISRLMDVIDDDDYRDLITLYLNTGARRQELLQKLLSWEKVNFDAKTLTLEGKGGKTRHVPLNKTAYEILYRRRFIENRAVPFDQNYESMYNKISKYYALAGIENANIHTLRKTFGSLLVQKGVDIFVVSKLLGHSSVKVTEKHYTELLDKNLREGVSALD